MKYMLVKWKRSKQDYPVLLYSEIDDNRWETRKVEFFLDGKCGFASATESNAGTRLGEAPIPSLPEIAKDVQFEPREITKEQFESVWDGRRAK
jgi:hypothetical protein